MDNPSSEGDSAHVADDEGNDGSGGDDDEDLRDNAVEREKSTLEPRQRGSFLFSLFFFFSFFPFFAKERAAFTYANTVTPTTTWVSRALDSQPMAKASAYT